MSLEQSLDQLYRYLGRLWNDPAKRPGKLSHSEYEYLRGIERLDGDKIAKTGSHSDVSDDGHHLQDLVAVLGVNKASASVAVAKLEKKGLVQRFPCQFDARAQHIVLTPLARACLTQEEVVYQEAVDRINATLTPEEQAQLAICLDKITGRAR
ncbi:MarR family winged helix-turn-helix transcriptional regulator [Aestuariispira insulae]|uniref:MarR family transcriptional regulator n=1 Tax=Aestuariispira insulae TaxID=1461337 RepID=A0A3D9HWW7_9PROT|nr:MarR family winged helix-turn-helix transcriptional regulator [Aestuariispira insulae]RED53998.1 MarR family transcriptional regulator [Aestuariispira insulae]